MLTTRKGRDGQMKVNEAVREIMTERGVRPADLRRRLGLESNAMANRLSRDSMTVTKLVETLRALDYKLVAVPNDARVRTGEIEIE